MPSARMRAGQEALEHATHHPQGWQAVTPATAAGRALFLIDHPYTHPTTWDAVDQDVRDWWTDRAAPITQAIQETT